MTQLSFPGLKPFSLWLLFRGLKAPAPSDSGCGAFVPVGLVAGIVPCRTIPVQMLYCCSLRLSLKMLVEQGRVIMEMGRVVVMGLSRKARVWPL